MGQQRFDLGIAAHSGYADLVMDVSVAEAKDRLPELIREMENGEPVILTREGKPVAQIAPPPPERRTIRWGTMRDRIKLLPGWDDPITEEEFLGEDL
jgi:prevent-host-death family protein